jgi:hypothetical protein
LSLLDWYQQNREGIAPLLAPLGSLVVGFGTIVVGGLVARAALRQAEIASQRHEAQTKADQQRRIIESFSKAIEQLGSDKLEVRLGGIYALERISRESPSDHWPVMETLTAFVRERAHWEEPDTVLMESTPRHDDKSAGEKRRPPIDIAAVLTVIARRRGPDRHREARMGRQLDLGETDLRRANLSGTHLEDANLSGAHLEAANLSGAHLERAHLHKVHLEGAQLFEAHLERASIGARENIA